MPVSRIRLGRKTADYIVVDTSHAPDHDTNASDEPPSPRAPYMTRGLVDDSDSSDDEDDHHPKNSTVTATPTLREISTPVGHGHHLRTILRLTLPAARHHDSHSNSNIQAPCRCFGRH
jgi:hypothetical protein